MTQLIFLFSAAAYWVAGWFLFAGTKRLKPSTRLYSSSKYFISAVIPARNEEQSLPLAPLIMMPIVLAGNIPAS